MRASVAAACIGLHSKFHASGTRTDGTQHGGGACAQPDLAGGPPVSFIGQIGMWPATEPPSLDHAAMPWAIRPNPAGDDRDDADPAHARTIEDAGQQVAVPFPAG
jgi:hypothetical protein